ncbi:MAG: response regulator transcription factor [Patescibacteria group bacterium]
MRVLVVEDKAEIRNTLKRNLEAECFAVDVASDGPSGLQLARLNTYDILILDNMLPGITGPELCSLLRAEAYTTPILILSVLAKTDEKVAALNAGADDYLTKPFSFDELLARVRALLRRTGELLDDVLEGSGVLLDSKRQVVTKDESEVHLTRKEFMLLEYFMRNPGTVLSRGMIMEHVWDMNADPFSNTIEAHIRSLRKKLGDGNDRSLIKTISGRGYRFD